MKVNIKELNRRLTEINDISIEERSIQKRKARIQRKIEVVEERRLRLIEMFGHEGPYTHGEYFRYFYKDQIAALTDIVLTNSNLFGISRDNSWQGGTLEIPIKKKLDHSVGTLKKVLDK